MADNMELFKQFQDNPSFKKWLSDLVFNLTYNKQGKPYEIPQEEHKAVVYDFELRQEELKLAEELPYGSKDN
jgi:type I restriction enzyme R subunit